MTTTRNLLTLTSDEMKNLTPISIAHEINKDVNPRVDALLRCARTLDDDHSAEPILQLAHDLSAVRFTGIMPLTDTTDIYWKSFQ